LNLPYSRCWQCGHFLGGPELAAGSHGNPKAGDYALCAYCDAPHVFRDDLTVRRLEGREWTDFAATMQRTELTGATPAGKDG
jgi:hypothetical protein